MLHPGKTQIVYCKDNQRRGCHSNQKFDFLGYTFRPRLAMNRWGKTFVNFSPGISNRAAQAIRQTMREWQLDCRIDKRIDDLAKMFNPIIRGWINYYGRYHKSALSRALMHLDIRLACWAMSKYRRLRGHARRARHWVQDEGVGSLCCSHIGDCCIGQRPDSRSRMERRRSRPDL